MKKMFTCVMYIVIIVHVVTNSPAYTMVVMAVRTKLH